MIELLDKLILMVKDLPDLAIWVLVGVLFYKTVVIGSIFGIIKLAIIKTHDALTKPKTQIIEYQIDKLFIRDAKNLFDELMRELRNARTTIHTEYIHIGDVEFLLDAIKEKKERDKNNV